MSKLLIGLGNPGEEYKDSRHNAGVLLVGYLTREQGNKRSHAAEGRASEELKAEKTSVFMNESGRDVRRLRDFYKVSNDDLYVAYDDLDIPLGSYKISKGKSPRVHNGINSVTEELGTEEFWHVRIGIDNREQRNKGTREQGRDYVLSDFTEEERETLERVFLEITQRLVTSVTPKF